MPGQGRTMGRWEKRAAGRFSKEETQLRPPITHIHDPEWGEAVIQAAEDIKTIQKQGRLHKLITEVPETETRLNQEYTGKDIDVEPRNLPNSKAHGSDGIPWGGGAHKASRKWMYNR